MVVCQFLTNMMTSLCRSGFTLAFHLIKQSEMTVIQKSNAIKAGPQRGFQNGNFKVARGKCYGYTVSSNGKLEISSDKAKVVSWIFKRCLAGDRLRESAAGLDRQGILSLRANQNGIGER